MLLIDFLPKNFPARTATDGHYLYRTLGSFWTQIFTDKSALLGYTIGTAEEIIQSYIKLAEVINQYSIKSSPIYHTEKWKPLKIRKSLINKSNFIFETTGAVFGIQPDTDQFYTQKLFRFGLPKQTNNEFVFSFSPDFELRSLGGIADRIISPTLFLLPGVDFVLKNNSLFFNSDIFNNPRIPKVKLVSDLGEPVTYKDIDGKVYEDEYIVLWIHNAQIDEDILYTQFGSIFELKLPSSQSYKDLLKALMNFCVEGGTIKALKLAIAALSNVPVIQEQEEVVENIYSDDLYNYLITDKNVYRTSTAYRFQTSITVGAKLQQGDIVTDGVQIIDSLIRQAWWLNEVKTNKLAVASHVFAANIHNQLFFENSVQFITYVAGKLNFPVLGRPEDVEEFQTYINLPENKQIILDKLDLADKPAVSVPINPLDFVFSNFLKTNTLLVKLSFTSQTQLSLFFDLLPIIQPYLPPHVYLLTYLNLQIDSDTLESLNSALRIAEYPDEIFSMDGSKALTGERPGYYSEDPMYYKALRTRMFSVALGPYKNGQPLHADGSSKYSGVTNLEELSSISAGTLRTYIPDGLITLPGDDTPRRVTTKEVPTILLIDF